MQSAFKNLTYEERYDNLLIAETEFEDYRQVEIRKLEEQQLELEQQKKEFEQQKKEFEAFRQAEFRKLSAKESMIHQPCTERNDDILTRIEDLEGRMFDLEERDG